VANGIVNVASFALTAQPNGSIAPGSMVVIFGTNMGPAALQQAGAYPLPTTLGGTSVKVTSGGVTADGIMIYTSPSQISAIIPSAMPAGAATLTVTYNGKTTLPAAFKIVPNSFGIFAANQGGSGPGVITNGTSQVVLNTNAVNPGEVAVIWGTGLGAVKGNEAAGALPGDLTGLPVEVNVGGQSAAIIYRGRSGCCAGVDQIAFTVPADTNGCRVPVTVKINDVVSNPTSIAVASAGSRTCSDQTGPTAVDMQRYSASGATVARIALTRTNTLTITKPISVTITTDTATATFFKYSAAQLNTARNPFNAMNVGSCSVISVSGTSAFPQAYPDSFPLDPIAAVSLDAGANITVTGPGGAKTLLKGRDSVHPTGSPAYYSGSLAFTTALPAYLEPGTITVSGTGGKDVGPFTATVDVPAILKWTNMDSVLTVNRAAGQLVTWTGGDPAGTVIINGTSLVNSTGITNLSGAAFTCYAKASDGQFTIPASVLLSLPVNSSNSNVLGFQYGRLQVGTNTALKGFTPSGIDFGYSFASMDAERLVDYQ